MKNSPTLKYLNNYTINTEQILGKGSTGCVYEGYDLRNYQRVAVKMIDLQTINNEVASFLLKMEKTALMNVENQYLLKGLKVVEDGRYCYLVTEFCNGGTLKKEILNSQNLCLSENKALKIFYCLLRACRSMAQKGILHRDLKPANIMFHQNLPKIIDFGYCDIQGYSKPSVNYNVGSPSYMAPQSYQYNIYSEKSEIWSLGVILYEMLVGNTIDNGRPMSQVYLEIDVKGINYPSYVSYFARHVINWCLKKNPKNRPTCHQLIESCFPSRRKSKTEQNKTNIRENHFWRDQTKQSNKEVYLKEEKISNNQSLPGTPRIDLKKIIESLQSCKQARKLKQAKQKQNQQGKHLKNLSNFDSSIITSSFKKQNAPLKTSRHRKEYLKFDRLKADDQFELLEQNNRIQRLVKSEQQPSKYHNNDEQIPKSTKNISIKVCSTNLFNDQNKRVPVNSKFYEMVFEEEQAEVKIRSKTERPEFFRA